MNTSLELLAGGCDGDDLVPYFPPKFVRTIQFLIDMGEKGVMRTEG